MEELDDDFGELYADVEVQVGASINAIPSFKHVHGELDGNEEITLRQGFRSNCISMEVDAPKGSAGANSENGEVTVSDLNRSYTEAGGEKGLILENESDSDDDLHIVLNEEDGSMSGIPYCATVGNLVEGSDDEDEDDDLVILMEDDNSSKAGKLGDQLRFISDGLEQGAGTGTERGNAIKSKYHTQYKYIRSYGATYSSNHNITGSGSTSSFLSSSSRRGDWGANGFNQSMRSSSGPVVPPSTATILMPVQSGCGFCLPRNRTIFDVNIEIIDPKPWRHPGVDISDFFNFGLDEESWKEYCNHLEQIRQQESVFTSGSRPYQAYQTEYGKDAVPEDIAQLQQGERVSPVIKNADRRLLELPKGRAIQVEGGIGERRSSMDVRRPRNRDSDVVIQISVQESTEMSSCSSREAPGCTKGGSEICGSEMDLDQKAHSVEDTKLCPLSRSEDVSSGLSLDPGTQENNVPDECDNPNLKEHACTEIVEMIKDKLEEASKIPSEAGGCKLKAESSLGNQFHDSSSLSYSDSRSISYKAGADKDKEKTHNTAKRTSSESSTPDSCRSKGIGSNDSRTEPKDCRDNFGNISTLLEKNQCSRLRLHSVAKDMIHANDEVTTMESDRKCWADDDDLMTQSHVKKEQQRDYDFYGRENFFYYRECEMSIGCQSERLVKKHLSNGHNDFTYKRSPPKVEMNPYPRRAWHEREHFFEKRTSREFRDNNIKHKGYHIPKKGHSDRGTRAAASYEESAWLTSENHIYSDEERHSWRPRKRYELFEGRDDDFVVEHRFRQEFVQVNYQKSMPSYSRKREHFQEKSRRHAQACGQENEGSKRRERYWDSLDSDLLYNSCRSAFDDDEYWGHSDHENLSPYSGWESPLPNRRGYRDSTSARNGAYGSMRLDERDVDHWRQVHSLKHRNLADRNRNDYNADYFADGRRRYLNKSMAFVWPEVESSSRTQGKVDRKESFSPHGSSIHDSLLVKHEVNRGTVLFDDDQLEQDKKRMIREKRRYSEVGNHICSSHGMMETNVQASLRCRDSVEQQHFIGWEGKSHERSSKALDARRNNRIEKTNYSIDQEQRTLRHSIESYSCRVVPSCSSKGESNYIHGIRSKVESMHEYNPEHSTDPENRTLLNKSYSNQQDNTSVVEDGQLAILGTVKQNVKEVKWMSEKTSLAGVTKEKGATSEAVADNKIESYDNNRILATLAKMEKRRERFKEPITVKKESENNLKPQNDVTETTEVKQQRPTRKRRWGGS